MSPDTHFGPKIEIFSISVIITSPNAIAAFPSEPDIPET
jgi:hypothetical protein